MHETKKPSFFAFPARVICVSFALVIAVGTLLLSLPVSSKSGTFTPLVNCFFTATSATCVTGLIVYDTYSHWSLFGQGIILLLIQIGGLGLVTLTTFFNVLVGRKLGLRGMQLAQESINFSSLTDINKLTKMVVLASLAMEGIAALLLATTFVPKYGTEGIWISIFLAVSAFCNAGFDILGRETPFISLCNYNDDPVVLITIALAIIIGGLGFTVWHDLAQFRQTRRLSLHSKIVLSITGILLVIGTGMFALTEWNNPATMGSLTFGEKLLASFFQSVTTRTAGFNSIDMAGMHGLTKGLSCFFMFIGAAPGSTGGGVKVTTVAVLAMTIISVIRGREDTVILRRKIAKSTVYKSLTIVMLGLLAVCGGAGLLTLFLDHIDVHAVDIFFEVISAFGTVGLSVGVTGLATFGSKLVLSLLMFVGRVGPVGFALSLAANANSNKKEIIPEGKIIVG